MEEMRDNETGREEIPEEEEGYVQRPAWQVWGARIGLVIFLIFVAMQILGIARGGM